ncbi:MAG TPA: class I SAM-dependent methyltransferase [Pyrinomonadaceae bacterium]|nr:class I SAM-dependent methyltransferase [Pyrinomonadaceae bacterium]
MFNKEELSEAIAKAVTDSADHNFDASEMTWINRIESLRRTLCESSEAVEIIDYGAGSPELQLTSEEMSQGRVHRLTIGELCQNSSLASRWSQFLFKLALALKPAVCLEMGTCLGVSTAYLGAALTMNNRGKILTLEGSAALAAIAKRNLSELEVEVTVCVGPFKDNLKHILFMNAPIDFVFVDGHHDEQATLSYFQQMIPYMSTGAVIVLDDIRWSAGMTRAWKQLCSHPRVFLSVDLGGMGVCGIQ